MLPKFSKFKFKSTSIFLLLLLSSGSAKSQTESLEQAIDPAAPLVETAPATSPEHPPIPARTHPAMLPLSSVALPEPLFRPSAKTPLAWRAKASRLAQEKYKGEDPSPGPLCRPYDGKYADALMAVAQCCTSNGFKVLSINSGAGELLAGNIADPNSRLVFSIWENKEHKSWVKAAVEHGPAAAVSKIAVTILDTVCATSSPKRKI